MTELCNTYRTVFLRFLADYARVDASAGKDAPAAAPYYITVSQRLTVDGAVLVTGLAAGEDAFFTLASSYSGVSLDGMEELAVDAVSELFNVINGHFSSEMRTLRSAVAIVDPPRHGRHVPPPPDALLSCPIVSPIGTMRLIAAREEFLPAEPSGTD